MPPWPFFSSTKSGSPRAATTPEAIDDSLHSFGNQRDAFDYDSDEDFGLDDLQPPAPPFAASDFSSSRKGRHSRSLSGSLPALFGGRRRTTSQNSILDGQGPSVPQLDGAPSPRPRTAKARTEEEVLESGTCATCASKVQWPTGVHEFRCRTCLMINDLNVKPLGPSSPPNNGQSFSRAGTYPGLGPDRRGLPVTVERSVSILNRCIDDYLLQRHGTTRQDSERRRPALAGLPDSGTAMRNGTTPPPKHAELPLRHMRDGPSPSQSERGIAPLNPAPDAGSSISRLREAQARLIGRSSPRTQASLISSTGLPASAPAKPTRRPPPPPMERLPGLEPFKVGRKPVSSSPDSPNQSRRGARPATASNEPPSSLPPVSKYIFKPFETYIIQSFGVHESLNRSFSSRRPRNRPAAKSEDNLNSPRWAPASTPSVLFDGYDAQIDAKTLLLGDVAENGLWWAGREETEQAERAAGTRQEEVNAKNLVHAKSPHIDWATVATWYRLVVRAGDDWRERAQQLGREGKLDTSQVLSQDHIVDRHILEARVHVQKALIRSSEALLRRPGRPLKTPSDIRFLLVLLANPLLYPTSSLDVLDAVARDLATMDEMSDTEGANRAQSSQMPSRPALANSPRGYWERKHVTGIIKRALGLMSNLPNDCHRCLSSWLVRFNEDRFRAMVEMIQCFVTYRLGRQQKSSQPEGQKSDSLVPNLSGTGTESSAQLHAALGLTGNSKAANEQKDRLPPYSDDWQIKAAARVMAVLFAANQTFRGERTLTRGESRADVTSISRQNIKHHGQLLSISTFANLRVDLVDLVVDFETWERSRAKFTFCQYPFFFSVGSKIRILEHDAQRQMSLKARDAFFNSIIRHQDLSQYLYLKVRRDCLVEDSLASLSQTVAQGDAEIKKGLRVQFVGEEGVDAGGLRKEWFLLLVREIFDPNHGMFVYDNESYLCYFNPYTFEASEQYFLVGALLGLAIYNLTILDIALPPFLFKKLLASASTLQISSTRSSSGKYTLDDFAELHPLLAHGLRQLLEFDGNVQDTYCRDFVVEVERYGSTEVIPLCTNGANRPVTNSNRQEFVELYIRFLLDTQVARQFEPFKRGFLTVCGGNALSLFQPEEIELLIRGSDEQLDVASMKAVAVYERFGKGPNKVDQNPERVPLIRWFWEFLESADPKAQRRVLSFITGSDRIPAMGATSLVINIGFAGREADRFPIARTCFNMLLLYNYQTKEQLVEKLWRAVCESEGFGLK